MSDRSSPAKKWGTATIAVGLALLAELILGVFTGVGFDVRQVGYRMGNSLKPAAAKVEPKRKVETGSLGIGRGEQKANERIRCLREKITTIATYEAELREAETRHKNCMAQAKWDLVRMWEPEKWCFGAKANKLSAEVRLEIARQDDC